MKTIYALVFFLAIGYVFAQDDSESEGSNEIDSEEARWWSQGWPPECPEGRVWSRVRCVKTCATLYQKCEPGPRIGKCVCRRPWIENSQGRCVLSWSKKCRQEAWGLTSTASPEPTGTSGQTSPTTLETSTSAETSTPEQTTTTETTVPEEGSGSSSADPTVV